MAGIKITAKLFKYDLKIDTKCQKLRLFRATVLYLSEYMVR